MQIDKSHSIFQKIFWMVKILICTFVLRSQHSSYGNPETLFLAIKKQRMFTKGKTALPTKIEKRRYQAQKLKTKPR